jgi:hypothetical protein
VPGKALARIVLVRGGMLEEQHVRDRLMLRETLPVPKLAS